MIVVVKCWADETLVPAYWADYVQYFKGVRMFSQVKNSPKLKKTMNTEIFEPGYMHGTEFFWFAERFSGKARIWPMTLGAKVEHESYGIGFITAVTERENYIPLVCVHFPSQSIDFRCNSNAFKAGQFINIIIPTVLLEKIPKWNQEHLESLSEIELKRLRHVEREREKQETERARRKIQEKEDERIDARKKEENARRDFILQEIRNQLKADFLGADFFYEKLDSSIVTEHEFEAEKFSFAKKWIGENTPSKNGLKQLPDDEQAAAISLLHEHVQVIARAGSGKTTTLVNRALFLLKHCNVAPREILILAFNRKAALEIRRRLLGMIEVGADDAIRANIDLRINRAGKNKRIDRDEIEASAIDAVATRLNITLPHIMTFHALAYAIVHPEESLLYNGAEGESQGLNRVFQRVIDDQLQNPVFRDKIRELMLAHFRDDWDRIIAGRYDQSKEELLRFRRSLPKETIGGDYVKSLGEKAIGDFLFEHDIAFKYERNHWWGAINYRPDFTIFKTPKSGVIIEYFGLRGDSNYDEMSDEKRIYWRNKPDWTLIEFFPIDIAHNGIDLFRARLKKHLESEGVTCVKLSEDEIWHRVRDRAIDRFTSASAGFIGRCRKQSLTPSALQELIESYSPISSVEAMFLELAKGLYSSYLDRLHATGEEDFDGLMQRASEAINGGITDFHRKSGNGNLASLRYVCIDEFQDFSHLFYRLLGAIRKKNPTVELFCVGDDWQAINGFAGSDLRFFTNFEKYIGKARRLYISTNYRSTNSIVTVGNILMAGLGKPAIAHKKIAGKVLVSDLNKFEPSLVEKQRHPGDIITPAVCRLANSALAAGLDVVMLSRRNSLPWFVNFQNQASYVGDGITQHLELVRSFFPVDIRDRISVSTAHKYKGLEKSMVIVLDAVARSYPLIHPDWTFSRILGDSPEKISEEERRLFYVALTRAVDTLVVITDGRNPSPFLDELQSKKPLDVINWVDYPPVQGLIARVVVKIGNQDRFVKRGWRATIEMKDILKASGYKYQTIGGPGWVKSFLAKGFTIETLKSEVWAESAYGIDVSIFDDTETLIGKFQVNSDDWDCEFDNLLTICAK